MAIPSIPHVARGLRYRVFFQADMAGSIKSQVDTDQPPGAVGRIGGQLVGPQKPVE